MVSSAFLHADSNFENPPSYLPGEKIKEGQLPGGYNKSASYKLKDSWDVYFTADYICWDWLQCGLKLDNPGGFLGFGETISVTPATISPGYASGFQVGFGFNMRGMDDWNFYSQYTYYRNSGSTSQFADLNRGNPTITGTLNAHGSASISFDMLDALIQRPFYFGKKLTANFVTGLKALWISNDYDVAGSVKATMSISAPSPYYAGQATNDFEYSSDSDISSWSLGPKFGFESNWLLGYGVKVLSNVSVSVLYTQYSGHKEETSVGFLETNNYGSKPYDYDNTKKSSYNGVKGIKPMLETYLGLGWGRYICNEQYHLDVAAGWDFDLLRLSKNTTSGSGNLGLSGFNLKFRFDF